MKTLAVSLAVLHLFATIATRADEIVLSLPTVSAEGVVPDATATDLMPFKVYNFSVQSMAFSPDGQWLATGDGHGDLRLWDVAKGQLFAVTNAHEGWLFTLAWRKDARTLVTGGKDRMVDVRDIGPPFKLLHTFEGHAADVHGVALTPDESRLVSGGDDRTVRIWDVAAVRQVRALAGHDRQIPTVAISPDGRSIASGSRDRTIRLWDLPSGTNRAVLTNHTGDVMSVKFSPDGLTLASGSYDQTIRLWDVKTLQPSQVLTGHTYRVYNVAFGPDGKRLASAGDKSARIWEMPEGKPLRTFVLDGKIRTGQGEVPGSVSAVAYSPDGRKLAIATTMASVLLVEADSGKVLHRLTPKTLEQ